MKYSNSTLDNINASLDIVQVAEDYNIISENRGGRYWACCPFHNEKTASFTLTPGTNLYYCFGCHKGGNLFNFVMEMEHISFPEAVETLAEKAGIALEKSDNSHEDAQAREREALLGLYEGVRKSFRHFLKNDAGAQEARDYLAMRGISEETQEAFSLGYAPDSGAWLYSFLRKKNYSESFLAASGLFSRKNPKYSIFRGRLMFPVFSARGQCVAFSGRIIGRDDGPKYINSPETPIYKKRETLFGLSVTGGDIRKEKEFVLVEGNVDVLALYEAGLKTAVAPLGTAFTREQAKVLKRHSPGGVVFFDGDDAGTAAAAKAIVIAEDLGMDMKVISAPSGMDPADILKKSGAESLKDFLKYPINNFDFLLNTLISRYDIREPGQKEQVVRELIPYLEVLSSEVRRDSCLLMISEVLGIEKSSVAADYEHITSGRKKTVRREARPTKVEPGKKSFGTYLLKVLLFQPSLREEFFPSVSIEEISEEKEALELYHVLKDNPDSGFEILINQITSQALGASLMEDFQTGEFSFNNEIKKAKEAANSALNRIKIDHLTKKRAQLSRTLNDSTSVSDSEKQSALKEMVEISGEIEKLKLTMIR